MVFIGALKDYLAMVKDPSAADWNIGFLVFSSVMVAWKYTWDLTSSWYLIERGQPSEQKLE
eukprot:CAMPEP_0116895446 /NCGR_PEP_ID=MMETSP0467-20121206/4962_1 /TAXON_ID=283647 /ORGANISM="Mesodinium pulex, Strain SPMC105" /LENGTH=60 /DNA_ID=CAMNT_0004566169 /DNA_START=1443 /DNA_END=1625 /DNA_ORIENTATION=+